MHARVSHAFILASCLAFAGCSQDEKPSDESPGPSGGAAGRGGGGVSPTGGTSNRGGASPAGGTSHGPAGGNGNAAGGARPTGGNSNGSGGVSAGSGDGGAGEAGAGASGAGAGSGPDGACDGLELDRDVQIAGTATDRVKWNDAACRPRTAALVRVGGGYVRQFSYEVSGKQRVATGTGANGHPGFGYTVNHVGDGALIGYDQPGQYRPVFVGRHHLIYEYVFEATANLPVTLHWLFATGRDNPLLAIHYDLRDIARGYAADTRTPYGDIAWDGDENAATTVVSGVGWGDRYRFITTTAPLTMNSEWTYTEQNVVPYVFAWADASDAEMGIVQTQTQEQHDAGGYWFYTNWGKTSANQTRSEGQVGNMPITWNWTYQINQYELCIEDPSCVDNTTRSHRLAWGANYGAVGGADETGTYNAYGDDELLAGYPYQSYSVFVVLGPHTRKPVIAQAEQIERLQAVRLTTSVGALASALPSGVGDTPNAPLDPPGYDARYSTFNVIADANRAAFEVDVPSGALSAPVVVISDFTAEALPGVRIDGKLARPDLDYFASLDQERSQLWLTFVPGWSGTQTIEIE